MSETVTEQQLVDSSSSSPSDYERGRRVEVFFSCKKCSTRLCDMADIAPHTPGEGQQAFSWHKREMESKGKNTVCTSLFVNEQKPWMADMNNVDGKLFCPKCSSRVGSYNWSGEQCSCGWVAAVE